ncbi:hypothetical protein AEGHOMDF_1759 [Methylobacterium soli]|nr:hypothetical protein AEGHOMDF_1759 [Methylobacterium soli]
METRVNVLTDARDAGSGGVTLGTEPLLTEDEETALPMSVSPGADMAAWQSRTRRLPSGGPTAPEAPCSARWPLAR